MDETGIDEYLHREYGWAPKGEKVYGEICGRKYKRTGVVSAWMKGGGLVAPLQFDGTMKHDLFERWFSESLLPSLPEGAVVIMDNASFHRKKPLAEMAEKAGHKLLFLPPYSPELNPIEHYWSCLKRHLKKILPSYSSFDDALYDSLQVA